ncbi:protein NO VEIN domain-containing protein [Hymenobacter daeguensis]
MDRIVFFRIGWMKNYTGPKISDTISGGGSWPEKGEVYNYSVFKKSCYGYVQPPSNASGINLSRIDAGATGSSLADVTVVWIANRPGGGSFIIGWYRHAKVYATLQPATPAFKRNYGKGDIGYFAKAKEADCTLLDDDERLFEVPRGEGYPGRSNTFYQDKNPLFAASVLAYINAGGLIKDKSKSKDERARQPDILKRIAVEKAAIDAVATHYTSIGYGVVSVEKDNVGWDLTATRGRRTLNLEVKGLSGTSLMAELTPNEYQHLLKKSLDYKLCIVCNALTTPELHIFSYENNGNFWSDSNGNQLRFQEMMSARVSAG